MTNYIYNGGGFLQGVPARDLTEDEFDNLPEETKAEILASGLYELMQVSSSKKKGE